MMTTHQAPTRDDKRYVAELSAVEEACRKKGVSFESLVRRELTGILGAASAQACISHLGEGSLSEPRLLVDGLNRIFGSGADVLLRRLAAASVPEERE
jgi:hypothetical protein